MVDVLSSNLNLLEMTTGTASGAWGADLNTGVIAIVDTALGSTQSVSLSSTDVTLTMTQRQNLRFALTGTLTTGVSVILPFQTNSTTAAVGGIFVVDNQCTGNFAVTVKTAAPGSTGVQVPQGTAATVVSDTVNVLFADDTQNRIQTYNGNPNGNVAGTAASASTRASVIIDRSTNTEYLCTSSGTASSAIWFTNLPFTFPCQGYLTASNSADNVILTTDSIGANIIYYTAYRGNEAFVYNGTSFSPLPIAGGQISLSLSASSQAANGIYDVIFFSNSGVGTVGFSPAWQTNAAGSCARGIGAGTPQMTRINGVPVNAVQQTVNNGSTTYTVAANRGTIVGTVFIDSSAGQVTCHRSWGQSRKFGIWNTYNREPIVLKAGDSTSSWTYTSGTVRASNGNSANKATVLMGFAEEQVDITLDQNADSAMTTGTAGQMNNGVGVNATNAYASDSKQGMNGGFISGATMNVRTSMKGCHIMQPSLGINDIQACESVGSHASIETYFGGANNMVLEVRWRG